MGLFNLFNRTKHQPKTERNIDYTGNDIIEESYEIKTINCTEYSFDNLSGAEFEDWCAQLLKKNGYINVRVTKASGDQGVDILAEKNEIKYAIQCKCYSSYLGNSPIQEVHAGKSMYNCHVGVVMTNQHFTSGAKELAKATDVLLWDREKLLQMMRNSVSCEEQTSSKKVDNLLLKALELILENNIASPSLLQRKLCIGYARAVTLMEELETLGVVGEANGSKPRDILLSKKDIMKLLNKIT